MKITNYFVLDAATETTIAICPDATAAEWIAKNYPEKCIIRSSTY